MYTISDSFLEISKFVEFACLEIVNKEVWRFIMGCMYQVRFRFNRILVPVRTIVGLRVS